MVSPDLSASAPDTAPAHDPASEIDRQAVATLARIRSFTSSAIRLLPGTEETILAGFAKPPGDLPYRLEYLDAKRRYAVLVEEEQIAA